MATSQNYPSQLPGPIRAAYGYSEIDHVRQNDVQSGPPRFELLNEDTPGLFDAVFSFTDAQLQLFESWFSSCLAYGAVSFNIDLPVGGGRVAHEANMPRFSRVLNGKRWRVSARLITTKINYGTVTCP